MRVACLAALAALACGPTGISKEEAQAAVEAAFAEANPAGHAGAELRGKAVWLEAPFFERACLEQNDLAFTDEPSARSAGKGAIGRISPTYMNQRYITASTPTGYCVYMGENPTLTIEDTTWGGDVWRVTGQFGYEKPSPWAKCLAKTSTRRTFAVKGNPETGAQWEGKVDMHQGACPTPIPHDVERTSKPRPKKAPTGKPSGKQVVAAVQAFDDALYAHDGTAALDLTSCYNLEEDQKVGTCSLGEVLPVGPVPRGEERGEDGAPWHEYAFRSIDDLAEARVVGDRDPTMVHVVVKHKRTGRDRSFALQWADNTWKMVGVVGARAETLTGVRYMYDLHKSDKREVFERRLKGEKIDEAGHSTDPDAPDEE